VTALKRLKLGRVVETLPDRLVLADKQDMTFDDLLLLVLTDEITRRDNAATDIRANQAGLDPAMRLELWDKTAKVSFDKRMLAELVSLRFLEAHRHVAVLGPVGVARPSYRRHSVTSLAATATTCASHAVTKCCEGFDRVGSITRAKQR
jgi:hypothetical protein